VAVCHAFGVQVVSVPELFPYGIYSIREVSLVGKKNSALIWAERHRCHYTVDSLDR
jgi:hypothetical protein